MPARKSLIDLLHRCRQTRNPVHAKQLYAYMCRHQLESHGILGSFLVSMLVDCGNLPDAQQVFRKLDFRNEHSWTSLISGFVEDGHHHHAFTLYQNMQQDQVPPSRLTFVALLKASTRLKDIERGRKLHFEATVYGLERDIFLGSTILDMYGKCGLFGEAQQLLDNLPVRDAVAWNALIAGYAEHGFDDDALRCYQEMLLDGISPTDVTFICSLKACGSMGALKRAQLPYPQAEERGCSNQVLVGDVQAMERGWSMCVEVTKRGWERDIVVGSTMVDMYAKCGSLAEAQVVLDQLPVRNLVSWTALIAEYTQHGFGEEALECFRRMQLESVSPGSVTFACSLKACGITGAIETGQQIHTEIIKRRWETELHVGNALLDMYAKCSMLAEARNVFDSLPVRDVISWSAMVSAYGENHEGNMAVQCFEEMQNQGVKPDAVTFTCVLGACSHACLVDKGQQYFKLMKEHGIKPTLDHHTCMVDLLARTGSVYEAERFAEAMQCLQAKEILTALLTGCKIHGEVDLGVKYFQQLLQVQREDSAAYTLMADTYANASRWHDANKIEDMRIHAQASKKAASASVEVDKRLHEFVVGVGQTNSNLSGKLRSLNSYLKDEGHVPNLDVVVRHVIDQEAIFHTLVDDLSYA